MNKNVRYINGVKPVVKVPDKPQKQENLQHQMIKNKKNQHEEENKGNWLEIYEKQSKERDKKEPETERKGQLLNQEC